MKNSEIKKISATFDCNEKLYAFLDSNPQNLSHYELLEVAEHYNSSRSENSAFFTDESLVRHIVSSLPSFKNKNTITILEPSVGVGNFLPHLIKKYKSKEKVTITVNDIDPFVLTVLELLISKLDLPSNFEIIKMNKNYLDNDFGSFDLIIGNPPYKKVNNHFFAINAKNKLSKDLFSYFLEKALKEADVVSLIIPKMVLGTPMYAPTRDLLESYNVLNILDFGEKGFYGVKIETIGINVSTISKSENIRVFSHLDEKTRVVKKSYIFDKQYPNWLLYRNEFFDKISSSLEFNIFKVFRDRQLTNSNTHSNGEIRILRSRNIESLNTRYLPGYDKYINKSDMKKFAVAKYLNEDVVLVPNMTYYPRACWLPKNTLVNGSVAILEPLVEINDTDLEYFGSDEFKNYYKICRNFATRTLNIDKTFVFYFGKRG